MGPDMDPDLADVFEVRGGAEFTICNAGANSYLFRWTDPSGTFTDVEDPTLVRDVGATYTLQRTTSAHPFRITTDALPVTGTDGDYFYTCTVTSHTGMTGAIRVRSCPV